MKKVFLNGLVLFCAAGMLFTACNKEEVDTETQSASDNSMAETEFAMVFSTANQIVINEEGTKKVLTGCYTVSPIDSSAPSGWPRTLTIDFGTGCVGDDGRLRSGKIDVSVSDYWTNTNAAITANLVDYYVNGLKHTGVVTATNKTMQGANTRTFEIDVANASIVTQNGTINWQSNRTIEWLQGFNTDTVADDIYDIIGTASGTNRRGKNYDVNISSPVRVDMGCDWIPSGVIDLTPEGLSTRSVDFGDGTCDNKATVIINGTEFDITML